MSNFHDFKLLKNRVNSNYWHDVIEDIYPMFKYVKGELCLSLYIGDEEGIHDPVVTDEGSGVAEYCCAIRLVEGLGLDAKNSDYEKAAQVFELMAQEFREAGKLLKEYDQK